MPNAEMPFFFIIGDEAPYPYLDSDNVRKVLGTGIEKDLNSQDVFKELYDKFKGNVFFLQNPYCGRQTDTINTSEIHQEWVNYIGSENAEKVIPILEEKSVADIILGIVSRVSGTRDMQGYITDMKDKGQTPERIEHVQDSLKEYNNSLVPYTRAQLTTGGGKPRQSGGRKL